MFSFLKNKKTLKPAPEWASFFSPEEYQAFVESIAFHFRRRKLMCTFDNDILLVDKYVFGTEELGLHAIAQMCSQQLSGDYVHLVAKYFDELASAHERQKSLKKP